MIPVCNSPFSISNPHDDSLHDSKHVLWRSGLLTICCSVGNLVQPYSAGILLVTKGKRLFEKGLDAALSLFLVLESQLCELRRLPQIHIQWMQFLTHFIGRRRVERGRRRPRVIQFRLHAWWEGGFLLLGHHGCQMNKS